MCVCYNVCEFALTCLLHLNFLRQRTLNSLARKFLSCHNRVNSRTQRRPLLRQTNLSLKPRRPMRVTGTSTQAVSVFVCFKFACYNFVCATTWLRHQNKEQKNISRLFADCTVVRMTRATKNPSTTPNRFNIPATLNFEFYYEMQPTSRRTKRSPQTTSEPNDVRAKRERRTLQQGNTHCH